MIKFILIDGNRTIENSDEFLKCQKEIFRSMANVISRYVKKSNFNIVNQTYKDLSKIYGKYIWEHHPIFWRYILDKFISNEKIEEVVDDIYSSYLTLYSQNIKLYSDVIPFLEKQLKFRKIALVANGNYQRLRALIKKFSLYKFFDAISISGETPFQKPESFLFEYALNKLNAKPDITVMIGDKYDTDIYGAKNMGIKSVHILRKNHKITNVGKPWSCADAEIQSLNELDELLNLNPIYNWPRIPAQYKVNSRIIKDAIVLCGGRGKRMDELTVNKQKCLLPVGGIPMLDYVVRTLSGVGCERIFFMLGYKSKTIIDFIGDGKQYGIKPIFINEKYKSTLDCVLSKITDINDSFYYLHGNILYPPRLLENLWLQHCETNSSVVVLVNNGNYIRHARMKINNRGEIISVDASGNATLNSGHLFMGLAIYTKNIFLENIVIEKNQMTEKIIELAIANEYKINSIVYTGKWRHYETKEDYFKDKNISPSQLVLW